MSHDQSDEERLDYVADLLTADGWPDWLDSTFIDASGPTVQVRPDVPAEALATVHHLAATHNLRVTIGETGFRLCTEQG